MRGKKPGKDEKYKIKVLAKEKNLPGTKSNSDLMDIPQKPTPIIESKKLRQIHEGWPADDVFKVGAADMP
jgi:hypothetical protein